MKFRTSFDCSCSSPECCSGTRLRQLYKRVIDEKSGKPVIVPDRKEDTYQGIQISAKGRQVSELVARALRGDDNAVRPSVDSFVDLTNAPKDAMEAQNMIIRSREAFYSLPWIFVRITLIILLSGFLLCLTALLRPIFLLRINLLPTVSAQMNSLKSLRVLLLLSRKSTLNLL